MEETAAAKASVGHAIKDSLLRRKYVIPFVLACVILFCNTACGINSIIGFNTNIFLQSGLSDVQAHWGYVIFTVVNFLMTIVGLALVDKKGRKFLLIFGTSGIIVSLIGTALLFLRTEKYNIDAHEVIQTEVSPGQTLALMFDQAKAQVLLASTGGAGRAIDPARAALAIVYSYGDFTAATTVLRSDEKGAVPLKIARENCVPANVIEAFFKNPFANVNAARAAPLVIQKALISPVPGPETVGWWRSAFVSLCLSTPSVRAFACGLRSQNSCQRESARTE